MLPQNQTLTQSGRTRTTNVTILIGWLLAVPRSARAMLRPTEELCQTHKKRIMGSHGTVLRGWFVAAPAPRATLVFCHGHAGSKAPDLQYVPWLRERGYNVLLFDFRAHGESERNSGALTQPPTAVPIESARKST